MLLTKLDLAVGDTLELALDEDNAGSLKRTQYTIVGVVDSPLYVGTDRGSSTLGGGSVDAYVYLPRENFDLDYYTEAYFTFDGLAELDSYGDEYEDRLEAYLDGLDGLADQRAELRYDSVVGDAQAELDDARQQLDDAKTEAETELADAQAELADAREKLDDGWATTMTARIPWTERSGTDVRSWPTPRSSWSGRRRTWPKAGNGMRTVWPSIKTA